MQVYVIEKKFAKMSSGRFQYRASVVAMKVKLGDRSGKVQSQRTVKRLTCERGTVGSVEQHAT